MLLICQPCTWLYRRSQQAGSWIAIKAQRPQNARRGCSANCTALFLYLLLRAPRLRATKKCGPGGNGRDRNRPHQKVDPPREVALHRAKRRSPASRLGDPTEQLQAKELRFLRRLRAVKWRLGACGCHFGLKGSLPVCRSVSISAKTASAYPAYW